MKPLMAVPLLVLTILVVLSGPVCCQRPSAVNIGAVFTFDSVVGRVAKPAIEAAVDDVNNDPQILKGVHLSSIMKDVNNNVFMGSVDVFQLIEKEIVAIIGPQSSSIAHMVSEIANGLKIPMVSYAATDPTLSALQFPFFLRTTQSDFYQMTAIGDFIDFYEWKEVIAIYVDDDHGRNGLSALESVLERKMIKLYKLSLPVQFDENDIMFVLNNSKLLGPRVYVLHIGADPRLRIFSLAQKLQMMSSGYVWLATDWFSSTVDSLSLLNQTTLQNLQGVVSFRQHTPESVGKKDFLSRWIEMQRKGLVSSGLNAYGLCAYDTVWAVARSFDKLIHETNITFSASAQLKKNGSDMHLEKLKVFDGGDLLRKKLLETNFSGLTGVVKFDQDRNIVSGGYEVINIDKTGVHTVGYWLNESGFSVVPPEALKGKKNMYKNKKLQNITWPGGKTTKPRGWVIADDERPLRIGVPNRASFVEFVTLNDSDHKVEGYCIDIFLEARKVIPYDVPYRFVPFGDGHHNPSYDELTKMVANDVFDAVIGDIAIVTNRTMIVDFSQPYASSGLVIVVPTNNPKSSTWVFIKPFTIELWCITAASFVMIGIVIWILEHRVNDDFRGPPRRQLVTMFMFSFSTLFKTNQESTVSALGRLVMVVWLFLLMVITSSYTASLSSILTVQQLSNPITGIDSLITSKLPIGYQVGSFAFNYLVGSLHIARSRLISLGSPEEYEKALRLGPSNGGVAAIVDEVPYVELFLANRSDFGIIGQPFTRSGWGFAFQRGSPLAVDMSTAILNLSEDNELQKIREKWFCKPECPWTRTKEQEVHQLHLSSFWGLYLLCGVITLTAFLVFLLRMVRQFVRYKRRQMLPSSSTTTCSQVIYSFFDFIDEKEEAIKKMFTQCEYPGVNTNPARSA